MKIQRYENITFWKSQVIETKRYDDVRIKGMEGLTASDIRYDIYIKYNVVQLTYIWNVSRAHIYIQYQL